MRQFRHHTQVVRDEQDRHFEAALQVTHQVQDLGLNRHVQRGGWLVGNQELGVTRERHGDHHPLPHAA